MTDEPAQDPLEKNARDWLLEENIELGDLPSPPAEGPKIKWGLRANLKNPPLPVAVFRQSRPDRVEFQLSFNLDASHRDKYARLKKGLPLFILDLKALLLKHGVEFDLEELPDLRTIRLRQHIYEDAWSKDLFWRRFRGLMRATLDTLIFIELRLGDPSSSFTMESPQVH